MESLRATDFTKASVKAEVDIKMSEGIATANVREAKGKADALLEIAKAESDALLIKAQAEAKAKELHAAADYICKENEARGILENRKAEALGLGHLIQSAGNINNLNQYLMFRDGIIIGIAEQQANAVRGMNPKINVWQTGSNVEGLSGTINDIVKNGLPLLDGIKEQYGIDPLKNWRESNVKKIDEPTML